MALTHAILALLCLSQPLGAQALTTQVLSTFIYMRHGDRTPLYSPELSILTPYGAQQMYNAGNRFRSRYLTNSPVASNESTTIRDISTYLLNAEEVTILSTDDQYTIASAQAFMQGLYPPLTAASNRSRILGVSELANGSNVVAPMNGYQYPSVYSVSSYDLNSIWIDGAANCPAFTQELMEYYNTSDFNFLYQSSLGFYRGLGSRFLSDVFPADSLGYFNAYYIYDYLQYQYLHNRSIASALSQDNMTRAEILAADWTHAMFGNATDRVRSIAGRSLATQILSTFYRTIRREGRRNKVNVWVGDMAPLISFASLAGLTVPQNAIFYNVPPMAAGFVFELIALTNTQATNLVYPSTSDMYVRFYYLNGTDSNAALVAYPLFGRSPSQTMVSYAEFVNGLSKFSLAGVKDWCTTCGSQNVFCPTFTGTTGSATSTPAARRRISPAIAGVIGALVTLAVAGILFALLAAFAGFRVHKRPSSRKSDLGGFKGSQKLASDQDVTLPKDNAVVSTVGVGAPKGHERVGSWELRNADKQRETGEITPAAGLQRRPSFEDDEVHIDPYAPAVKPHDHV